MGRFPYTRLALARTFVLLTIRLLTGLGASRAFYDLANVNEELKARLSKLREAAHDPR